MDTYVLNGFDEMFDFDVMNGTNQAFPMNGTNQAIPMNGTNQAIPMNGTNQAIPMQGLNGGTFYVSPLSLLDEDDVPMNGIPDFYSDEDISAYRLGYMVGDPDAMNGLFSKFKEKRAAKKEERAERKEDRKADRAEKKDLRLQNKRTTAEKRASGTSFLDRVGGALANIGEAKKLMAQSSSELEDEGIDYDAGVLAERAALASEAGLKSSDNGGGGIVAWWNARPVEQKVGIGIGTAAGIYFGGRALGWWGKKKGKRK